MTTEDRWTPDTTIAYGASPEQVIDLFRADDPGDTLVVLIHGGFWREPDRTGTYRAARALAEAGRTAVTVEYRRGPGSWDAASADIAAVVDRAGELFADELPDLRRLVLVGHSAGGQLALWAASRASLPTSSPFRRGESGLTAVIGAAAAADLGRMAELGLGRDAVPEYLGADDTVPDVLSLVDPIRLRADVPVLLLHGGADQYVPVEISERYALGRDGAELEVVAEAGHLDWVDPDSVAWTRLLAAVDRAVSSRTATH